MQKAVEHEQTERGASCEHQGHVENELSFRDRSLADLREGGQKDTQSDEHHKVETEHVLEHQLEQLSVVSLLDPRIFVTIDQRWGEEVEEQLLASDELELLFI